MIAMISSTVYDLEEHRMEVMNACSTLDGVEARMMEHLTANPETPTQVSTQLVNDADVYVGVFARRYGTIPPGEEISITEQELNAAESAGKPCLIFLSSAHHLWTDSDITTGAGAEKLMALRARLERDYTIKWFDSAQDLRAKVGEALTCFMSEIKEGLPGPFVNTNLVAAMQLCKIHLQGLTQRKRMHDALHRIEIECYKPMGTYLPSGNASGSDNFIFPEQAEFELEISISALDNFVEELEDCLASSTDLSTEKPWVDKLRKARDSLLDGFENHDHSEVPRAFNEISSVLRRQPTKLNVQLISEAKNLRKSEFVAQLMEQCGHENSPDSDVSALGEILAELDKLVVEHDSWQTMDDELRLIKFQVVKNLEDSWQFVEDEAKKIYTEDVSRWPRSLSSVYESLNEPENLDIQKVSQHFLNFCVLASQKFDKVDQSLKRVCLKTVEAFSAFEQGQHGGGDIDA